MPVDHPSLVRLALPMIASFTTRFAFQFVDLIYARQILDEEPGAIAAMGFYEPFQALYIALWVGLSAGFTATLSAAFGKRDQARIEACKRSMNRLLTGMIPVLVLFGAALWVSVPYFGLEPELESAFRVYGTTMLVGMPLLGFASIVPDSIVKAHYDTRTTMMAGFAASFTNIALNSLFVFVFGLGLFGIALATVISRVSAYVYAAHKARALEAERVSAGNFLDPAPVHRRAPLIAILTLALPASLTFILTGLEATLALRVLQGADNQTESIASFTVYKKLLDLALMPTLATAVAVLPFVARTSAEGHFGILRIELRKALALVATTAIVVSILCGLVFPAEIGSFFASDDDPDTAGSALGRSVLKWLPIAAIASLPYLLYRPIFEALNQPKRGVQVTLLRFLAFSTPLLLGSLWFAEDLGFARVHAVIGSIVIASAAASITTVVRAVRTIGAEVQRAGTGTS